jgi:hypothetical protein
VNEFTNQAYEEACEHYLSLPKTEGSYRRIALQHFDNREAINTYAGIYERLVLVTANRGPAK